MRAQDKRPKRAKAAERPTEAPQRKEAAWVPWAFAFALAAITTLVFAHALTQDFVFLDDDYNVYQNPYLSPSIQIAPFWRGPYFDQYCPLTYTAYALIARFARLPAPMPDTGATLDPHLFHLATLALHVVNVVLVFFLVRTLLARVTLKTLSEINFPAAGGALLFALHPLQVESVAWVTDLQRVLCATFSLVSIHWYFKAAEGVTEAPARRWADYGIALAMGAAAALCKPSAVSLPLMLLVLDRWFLGRPWRDCLLSVLPWVVVIAPVVWLNHRAEPPLPNGVWIPLWTRPFQAGDALAFYLAKLCAPVSLAIDYGRSPRVVIGHWWGYATWLVPAALALLVFSFRRGRPWLVGVCLLSLAVLLPVLGLVPITFAQFSIPADRYIYLALLGPAILAAVALASVPRRIGCGIVSVVAIALSFVTVAQVRTWDNSETLFRHAIAVNPRSPIAHYDLANLYRGQGRIDDAIAEYKAAIASLPAWQDPHTNLGATLMQQGDYAQAIPEFEASLKIDPHDDVAQADLARARELMQSR